MLPAVIAPSRRSVAKALQFVPSRTRASGAALAQLHQAFLRSKQGADRSPAEYLSIGDPKVHVLRGFSSYRPNPEVLDTVAAKAKNPTIIGIPAPALDAPAPSPVSSFPTDLGKSSKASFSSARRMESRPSTIPAPQEAFYVLDLARVREKHALWQKCFPSVVPHYAVKANPNPAILSLMANELKINFDCASPSEIEAVLSLGVDPSLIIFANPCKSLSHISYARRMGVSRTTFDNEAELHKVKAVFPDAELVLRIWVDDKEAQCQLSNKYGAKVDEAIHLLKLAKRLGLDVIGVSFHAGSGAKSHSFKAALADAHKVFTEGRRLDFDMRLLDIGGGFPATEEEGKDCASLAEIAAIVSPILERDFQGVSLIAEPGRFFCAEAQTLATQIIGKRLREERREYTVNEGLYQSFNCMLYDHSILLSEEEEKKEEHDDEKKQAHEDIKLPQRSKHPSLLFGQTCDGLDMISKDIALPELRVGDWLVVPNMGAYTNGASSKFNGFELNQTIVVN